MSTSAPAYFSTLGLIFLADSMLRYAAEKKAREIAEQRLHAVYGADVVVDGADLAILQPIIEVHP